MKAETFEREVGAALRHMGYDLSSSALGEVREKCIRPELNHHRMTVETYPPSIEPIWRDLLRRHAAQYE
jgi:hypothetical protein